MINPDIRYIYSLIEKGIQNMSVINKHFRKVNKKNKTRKTKKRKHQKTRKKYN